MRDMPIGAALLHSVSYSGSWGQPFLELEDFIDKAAELGYGGVMLMAKRPHLSPLDYGAAERARLRSRIERRRLTKVMIAGYTNFTADLEHGDIPLREMQVQHVVALAELARDLGGDSVRVFTGYENPAAGYGAQWKIVVDCLRECARRSAEYGVTIGVQNHHDIGAGYESQYDLIRAVGEGNCRAMFDAWAPALHGADLAAAARRMAPVTCHTTIANYQLRPRYRYEPALVNYAAQSATVVAVPIDEGFIDYRAFLGALGGAGFEGSVAYEMCSPLRDGASAEVLDSYARRFIEFLASAWPRVPPAVVAG
jgi:sugar phosphate isomerase/epimerase